MLDKSLLRQAVMANGKQNRQTENNDKSILRRSLEKQAGVAPGSFALTNTVVPTTPQRIYKPGAKAYAPINLRSLAESTIAPASSQEQTAPKYVSPFAKNEDYGELSRYKSTKNSEEIDNRNFLDKAIDWIIGAKDNEESKKYNSVTGYTTKDYDDELYEYINRNPDVVSRVNTNEATSGQYFSGVDQSFLQEMEDAEIADYNYLYATQGKDKANEFLQTLKKDLTKRQMDKYVAENQQYARENPVAASAWSVLAKPLEGVSLAGQLMDYKLDRDMDPNAGYNRFAKQNQTIRQTVPENWSKVGQFLYGTGMSIADNLYNMALTGAFGNVGGLGEGAQSLILGIMGSSAAADSTLTALENGYSADRALIQGAIAGGIEALTEKISLETLLSPNAFKDGTIKYLLKNAAAEGSEEGASTISNWVVDWIGDLITDENRSDFRQVFTAFQRGDSKEGWRKIGEMGLDLAQDVAGGALSGGILAGAGSASNTVGNINLGSAINQNSELSDVSDFVRGSFEENLKNPDASKYQNRLTQSALEQLNNKGKVSNLTLGELAQNNMYTAEEQANTVNLLNEASQRINQGKQITSSQMREILDNNQAVRTLRDNYGLRLNDNMSYSDRFNAVQDALTNRLNQNDAQVKLGFRADMVAKFAKTLGSQGERTLNAMARANGYEDVEAFSKGYTQIYNAVKADPEVKLNDLSVKADYSFTPQQLNTIYKSAVKDHEADLKKTGLSYEGETNAEETATGSQDSGTDGVGTVSLDTEVSTGSVAGRAAEVESRREAADVRIESIRNNAAINSIAEVTSAEAGIPGGVNTDQAKTVRVLSENQWSALDTDTYNFLHELKDMGYEVKAWTGTALAYDEMSGKNAAVRGFIQGNTIGVRVDANLSARKIAYHEMFHDMVKTDSSLQADMVKKINEHYGEGKLETIVRDYVSQYGWTQASSDEILNEIFADAYAGIDIYEDLEMNYEGATQVSADVRGFLSENGVKTRNGNNAGQFSRDSEGNDISPGQAEYFKDSKIRDEDGNLQIVYHGTDADFTVFDRTKGRSNMDIQGSFFSPWELDASGYGSNVRAYYLNIKNPAPESVAYRALNRFKGQNNAGVKAREYLERLGYDGVNNGNEEYIAFHPEQIKEVENVSPTSNPDVRYSTEAALEQRGVELVDGTATKFSLDTWNETDKDRVLDALVKAGFGRSEASKWIDDVNSIAAIILGDRYRLDYDAADNQVMLKNNEEYVKTLDSSTLCAKRLLYQGTFNRITELLPDSILTPDDLIHIRKVMAEMGDTVPCGICYVESRRKTLSTFAGRWLNEVYKGKTKVTMNDLTSTVGLEKLRSEHPDIYNDYTSWMRRRGTANPKIVELRTSYRNDISKLTKGQIAKIIRIGGLRVQSFSDFETVHLIDMMQAILDMSAKGLTSQAYTKVPNFAWAFGDTGIKINLSLIGKAQNGRLVFDSKEGMDINDAMRLRERYSDNVGTILVGANDESILLAMADDRIDFIIPFHRSGWSQSQFEDLGLSGYDDYQAYQNERHLDGSAISEGNLYPIDYWDYSKTGKENAERYLEICKEQGRIPKFERFLVDNGDGSWSLQPDGSTDGYWKMLIDFKMYNNQGIGVPQRAVTPTFNMEECKRMLNEYDGVGNRSLPVNEEAAQRFVEEYKTQHQGQFSRDTDYMEAVNSGDMDTAQRMVDEVALSNPNIARDPNAKRREKPLHLYHGTNAFGFTEYKDNSHEVPFIYTSSLSSVAAHYAGDQHYAFTRPIGRKYDGGDSIQSIIKDAETVWGSKFTIAKDSDKARVYKDVRDEAVKVADKIDELYTTFEEGVLPWDVSNAIDHMEYLFFAMRDSDGETYDAFKESIGKEYEFAADIKDEADRFEEYSKKVREWYYENRDSLNADQKKLFSYLLGYELGDAAIDIEYKIGRMIESDTLLLAPDKGLQVPQKVRESLNQIHNIGAYDLYGDLGDNPFVIDTDGAQFWAIKVPEMGDGYYSTDRLSKWAYENGYTSVIMQNIYDYGDKADNYVFFNPNQIKSADPVTYDDQGNVIPLSQRFNSQNNDIRYSRDSEQDNRVKANFGTMFSGTGTVDFALRNVINHSFAVEYDNNISAVYRMNNGDEIYEGDVRDAVKQGYIDDKEVDFLHASPVCKDYSAQKQDATETPLDISTAKAVADVIDSKKPKLVTIENVRGYKNSQAVKLIQDALDRNGYVWDEGTYKASDFGGATIRERYFIRAARDVDELPAIPERKPAKSWYDATKDLIPDLKEMPLKEDGYMASRWNELKDSIDRTHPVLLLRGTKGGKLVYAEYDKPSPTIIASETEARIVMPDGRFLEASPRVLARIQGLPDEFQLPKQKTLANKVVGNGVPVELTQAVLGSLLPVISGEEYSDIRFSRDTLEYNGTVYLKEDTVDKYLKDYAAPSSPNYAQAYIAYMNPEQFLSLTTSRSGRDFIDATTTDLDVERLGSASVDQPIMLRIDHETGEVIGHEGRHRINALDRELVSNIPVLIFDSANKSSKTAMESLELTGQDFGFSRSYAKVSVKDVLPLSYANREEVIKRFATVATVDRIKERYGRKTIQYSRDTTGMESELQKQNRELNRELKEVTERYHYFKDQLVLTKVRQATEQSANRVAKQLVKDYSSNVSADEIAKALREASKLVLNVKDDTDIDELQTQLKDALRPYAMQMVANASELINAEDVETQKSIRNDLRNGTGIIVTEQMKKDVPDWASFRKAQFGNMKLVSGPKTNIHDVYLELSQKYGEGYFPADVANEFDMLQVIADVMADLSAIYDNPYTYGGANIAEAIESCTNDMMMSVVGSLEAEQPTFADKEKAKRDKLRKEAIEAKNAALQRVREQRDDALAKQSERYKDRIDSIYRKRKQYEYRGKIRKKSKDLSTLLLRPTDKRHIPYELQGVVLEVLKRIDTSSAFDFDWSDSSSHVPRGMGMMTGKTNAFLNLKQQLSELKNHLVLDPSLFDSEDGGTMGMLSTLSGLESRSIDDMNLEQLDAVYTVLRNVENLVRKYNKALKLERFETISEAATAIFDENGNKTSRDEYVKGIEDTINLLAVDSLTPQAYFHRLGKSGDALFKMLRAAQDDNIRILREAQKFSEDHGLYKLKLKKYERELVTVRFGNRDVEMSKAQLMELYVLNKRDASRMHLEVGGILPEPVQRKRSIKKVTYSEAIHNITQEDIAKAMTQLSAEDIALADAMQEFLSKTISKHGNDASMRVYGYKKFGEENYWPIRVNDQDLKTELGKAVKQRRRTVSQMGFTIAIKPNAKQSVFIGSIFDTFSEHVAEMATYSSYLDVMEDLNRIYNFNEKDESGAIDMSTKLVLRKVLGPKGESYFTKLAEDIANPVPATPTFLSGLIGKFKAAAVGSNLRVIIQQPTAIFRAMSMIDPKYLAIGIAKFRKGASKAVEKAPIAQWKEWGYFDISTGRSVKNILFENSSTLDRAQNLLMAGAGKADSVAWGALYSAVEAETKDLRPDLDARSKEFDDVVVARFSDIIDQTQVVDGVLQRSHLMRSENWLDKTATSFMAEPTKQLNMMMTAVYDLVHGENKGEATRTLARTTGALLFAGVLNAAVQSIVDAIRNDDPEKDYWEKFLAKFTGDEATFAGFLDSNLGDFLNPMQYVTYAKDIYSLFQGFEVERMDTSLLKSVIKDGKSLVNAFNGKGKYSLTNNLINFINTTSKFFGLSVSNVKRDVAGIANTIAQETGSYVFEYRMAKFTYNLNQATNKGRFVEVLAKAYEAGDTEAFNIIMNDLIKEDKFATSTMTTEKWIKKRLKDKHDIILK